MRVAIAIAFLAGCDPVWSVRARVRSPDGAAVPRAAMALTCGPADTSRTGLAALTDDAGQAELGGLGDELPKGCTLTVAKPGYRTERFTFEQLCAPKPIASCYRIRELTVALHPAR
jgi:hypothetical protein